MSAHSGPKIETTNLISILHNNNKKITSGSNNVTDVIGKNTISSVLSYDADGKTYYFNGSSYINIPYTSSMNFNSNQTIAMWIKPTDTTDARRNPYNQAYAGGGTITFETARNFNYFWGTDGTDGSVYTALTSSFTVARNETAHIAVVRTPSTVTWYKNGIASNSMTNPYASTNTGTNPIKIGTGYAGGFIGYIHSFKIYSSALSASAIKQDFISQRQQFNL